MRHIKDLTDRHLDRPAYIVGMGPSLLNLRTNYFSEYGPIIATYESIVLLESWGLSFPLYSLQKDHVLVTPQYAPLLLHESESLRDWNGYEPCHVFNTETDFGMRQTNTGWTSVRLALLMGCTHIVNLCCDMTTSGDSTRSILSDGKFVPDHKPDPLLYNQAEEVSALVRKYGATCSWITPR